MEEVSINVVGCQHILSKGTWCIMREDFFRAGITSIGPLVMLFRDVREVWLVRSDPEYAMLHLGQVSVDTLYAFQMTALRHRSEA